MGREENLELMRRLIEAWNTNDWETLEALTDPQLEIIPPQDWPEGDELHGWPAARRQFERLKEPLEEEHTEMEEVEAKGDLVLSSYRWRGRAAGSGIDFEMTMWRLDTIRGGRTARMEFFRDDREARAAFEKAG